jgi:hypothetical protein
LRCRAFGVIVLALAMLGRLPAFAQTEHPPMPGDPKEAWKDKEDPLRAKGLTACKVGDRVTASYEGQWVPAEVIAVEAGASYPCKIHMDGKPEATDVSFAAWMLRRSEDAKP